jgi:hypothetical protein
MAKFEAEFSPMHKARQGLTPPERFKLDPLCREQTLIYIMDRGARSTDR